jgi:hypothetical protein
MKRAKYASDQHLFSTMLDIKRHLITCKQCREAYRAGYADDICATMRLMVLDAVSGYDRVVGLRQAAIKSGKQIAWPCPRPAEHGSAYAQAVTPMIVLGIQEALF